MRKLLLLAVSLLLTVTTIYAERVSESDAALVAKNFMNVSAPTQSGVKKTAAKKMLLKNAASVEQNRYYVYEYPEGGWVMVAANDVARPIIAYSETGTFKTDNQPANVKAWLSAIDKKIIFAEQNNIEATEEVSQEWLNLKNGISPKNATVVVAPLITTTWDQDDPYWALCPSKGSSKTYVGCVATAMAQVMNFWKWPKQGTGSYSYTTEQNSLSCSADFANTSYDWDNMVDHYTPYYNGGSNTISVSTPTDAQKKAVATLMYHCGVAVQMEYGTASQGGSGAQTIYPNATSSDERCAQNALWKHFGYKKTALKGYYRPGGYGYSKVNDATWLNLLKTELDAKRPIMYAGGDSEGGHSFVCDGYNSDNYFHFNWGWSGYCDGYYSVDNMVPGVGGSGAGNGSYNDDQDIIIGIEPDKTEVTITWSVAGTTTTTTQYTGSLILPTAPSDCAGGKKFVGWTESSSVTGTKPADLFTSATGKVVTTAKTYYAVFATKSETGGTSIEKATSIAVGDKVILVYETDSKELGGISSTSTKYGLGQDYTDTPTGVFPLDVVQGNTTGTFALMNGSNYLSWSSVNSLTTTGSLTANSSWKISFSSGDAVIINSSDETRSIRWNSSSPRFACYTSGQKAVQLYKMGSGASYSNYSTTCGEAPQTCQLVGITLNTQNVKTSFFKGDAFTYDGLIVTAAYSNCVNKVVTPTNVSTPDMSTVGTKTVTVTYTENAVTKTKDYSITVAEKPVVVTYTVKWHSCDGVKEVVYNKGDALVFPTKPTPNAGKAFYGWITDEHYTGATAPTIISAGTPVNDDADYYAVYE